MPTHTLSIAKLPLLLLMAAWVTPLGGQSPDDARSEAEQIPIVIRISQELIENLTQDEVTLSLPIRRTIDGIPVTGQGQGTGRPSIEMETSNGRAEFTIVVRGTVSARFFADAGPASAHASTAGEFVARKRVRFDGSEFDQQPAETSAGNTTSIDRICSRHSGCVGRLVRHVARRVVRQQKSEVDAAARQVAEEMISTAFDELATALIAKLDQTAEFEQTVTKYFPETEGWIYHLATREHCLLAGAGPVDAVFPDLPAGSGGEISAPIEVWVRTTPLQAALIETLMVDWELAHDALREVLSEEEAQAVSEDIGVIRRNGWSVIQVGANEQARE